MQASRVKRQKALRKPSVAALVLSVLLLGAMIGGTVAFLTAVSRNVVNTFTPGTVTGEIEEVKDSDSKDSVKIKNTGNVEAYVRVAVVGNEVDETLASVIGAYDVSSHLAGSGWVKNGNYYYYTGKVAAGALTGELLTSPIPLMVTAGNETHYYRVTVAAELIQADGKTANGVKAVVDAWGVDPDALGS